MTEETNDFDQWVLDLADGEFWKQDGEAAIREVHAELVKFMSDEQVRKSIERLWYACRAEYGD